MASGDGQGSVRRRGLIVGALALGAGLQGCQQVYRYNYRLTVELEVDGILRRGSTVRSVRYSPPIEAFGNMSAGAHTTYGEAAVVDLGRAGYRFSTLGMFWSPETGVSGTEWTPDKVFGRELITTDPIGVRKVGARMRTGTKRIMTVGELPVFMRFDNPADPTSAHVVDPSNFFATYGTDVILRQVTVEKTRDKVTIGRVEEVLPWARRYRDLGLQLRGDMSHDLKSRVELYAPASIVLRDQK